MKSTLLLLIFSLSLAAAEVPVGEVMKFNFTESKIYPGTMRDVWVYVPKQYDGKTPACLWVNQDGIQFGAVKIDKEGKVLAGGAFDKLIAEKKMPVTIGVFVKPGIAKALIPNALDRVNRSYEYDSLGDNYAKFLIEELLPAVEKLSTPDGRKIVLSKDPNDRGIGGSSSGAICAFTVAWERPDSFRRIFSSIGSYADLRGGHNYPNLIRKMEPKPLRIFLEDGSGDLNNYAGDWWLGNQQMEKALKFMGYEVESKWGTGGHDQKHATEIFPEAMAWLWKDHPQPVKTGECKNDFLKDILIPGEELKVLSDGFKSITGMAINKNGEVFVSDAKARSIYHILRNNKTEWLTETDHRTIHCFDSKGNLFGTDQADRGTRHQFVIMDHKARSTVIDTEFAAKSVVSLSNGNTYVCTDILSKLPMGLYLMDSNSKFKSLDDEHVFLGLLAVSPDQSSLFCANAGRKALIAYQIMPDGSLINRQEITGIPEGIEHLCFDNKNRLWIATMDSIYVIDRESRIHCHINIPKNNIFHNNKDAKFRYIAFPTVRISFSGSDFSFLTVACGDKIYIRKVNTQGVNAFDPPIKPAPPKK